MHVNVFGILLLVAWLPSLHSQSQLLNHDFTVLRKEGSKAYSVTIRGNERKNNAQNRLTIISESQYDYPDPESGCGPIALLNTLVWYEKYGLIAPLFRESDSKTYKKRLFAEVDRRIYEKSGIERSALKGSRNIDIAIVLDEIVHQQSGSKLRVHTDQIIAPLKLKDMLATMPNFRTGYVTGYPKNPLTGEMQSLHVLTLVRADRAGYLTLSTWGEKYRGLLRMRDGKQWFIPQSPDHAEIQIVSMMRFIPFEPIENAAL